MLPPLFRKILAFGDGSKSSYGTVLLAGLEATQLLSSMAVTATGLYVVVLGKELGLSDIEIGSLVTGYAFALLISTYLFGILSDMYGTKPFLTIGFLFSSIMLLLHVLVSNYVSLLFARLTTGVALGIYPGALFSLAARVHVRIGRFSAYGSLGGFVGFVIASLLSGAYGTRALFVFGSIAVMVAFALAIRLKIPRQVTVTDRPSINPKRTLKENPGIYAALLLRHWGANLAWTFWPLYMLAIGANYFYVGFISALNYLAQFLGMFYLADRFGGKKEFDIGLVLSVLAFIGLGLATDLLQLGSLYVFTGIIWAFLYVGGIRTVVDHSNEKGAAIVALNSMVNLSTVLGPMLATVAIAFMDYRATMYVAAAFGFTSFLISKRIKI